MDVRRSTHTILRLKKPVVEFIKSDYDYSQPGIWVVKSFPELGDMELDEVIVLQDTITYIVSGEDKSRSSTLW